MSKIIRFFTPYLPLILLLSCSTAPGPGTTTRAELYPLTNPPLLREGTDLHLGGFSGLAFEGKDENGQLIFWTHTDRGPNAFTYKDSVKKQEVRPFLIPDYQLRWVRFSLDDKTHAMKILNQVMLTSMTGKALTGLPNLKSYGKRAGDEIPVNSHGEFLALDEMGLDTESMCFDKKNFVWMGEEYRPSLLKFTKEGKLLKRYVPRGSYTPREIQRLDKVYGRDIVLQVLPEKHMDRKTNRGYEGIACLNDKIYVALQSPLNGETKFRIIEFDPNKEEVSREFFYPMSAGNIDMIGDMTAWQGELLVLEQNGKSGPQAFHQVFRVPIPEQGNVADLTKTFFLDVTKSGYDFADKVEGLAMVDAGHAAVINDNDFAISGILDLKKHAVPLELNRGSVLGIIPVAEPLSR